MTHARSPLSETGRLALGRCVVVGGWSLRRAAERFNVSVTTAKRWGDRYRSVASVNAGVVRREDMVDHSSRPHHCPRRTSRRLERRILGLRVSRRWGPARIGYHLGLHPGTVHQVLRRYSCPPLAWTDPATGTRLRGGRRQPRRYEHPGAGDLIHVDVKKLGRIPHGGGHRFLGRQAGKRNRRAGVGWWYIHNAVDDHSRLAYSELHRDERKETVAGFWRRARAFFARHGITIKRVLTDNGSAYRSGLFAATLAEGNGTTAEPVTHKWTRPYRPQTNGKVERFNLTLLQEWAYARPYPSEDDRVAAFAGWLHHYNHHRGHTALRGAPPISRVPNVSRQDT